MEPWWDADFSNSLGAWLGSATGVIFGGIGGGVGGPLAGKGKAKTFVLGMFWGALVIGVLKILFAIVAATVGQPWHVWQWPLTGGLLLAVMAAVVLPQIHRVYRVAEERKLAAAELRRA